MLISVFWIQNNSIARQTIYYRSRAKIRGDQSVIFISSTRVGWMTITYIIYYYTLIFFYQQVGFSSVTMYLNS